MNKFSKIWFCPLGMRLFFVDRGRVKFLYTVVKTYQKLYIC